MIGTTLFWRNQGWGYIAPQEQTSPDIFCHFTGLVGVRRLEPGQKVEFEVGERLGKPIAVNVKVLADTTSANGGRQ